MKQFLSFASIPEFHDRSPLMVSPIGELSGKTRLYSKDPITYPAKEQGINLVNFYSKDDNQNDVTLEDVHINRINDITVWLVNQAKAGNLNSNQSNCLQQLRAEFTKDIEIVAVGEMVTNTVVFLPSFVELRLGEANKLIHVKTWYANDYFAAEYPYRELLVDLPLPKNEIDYLLEHNYLEIKTRLEQDTPEILQDRIDQLSEGYPYTKRLIPKFEFTDIHNNQTIELFFTVLVYGNPNDIDEEIFEVVKEEILKHSKYPEDEWEKHLPDLFNPLEFTAVPYWNVKGLINKTVRGGSFSPIGDYETLLPLPTHYCPQINSEDLIKSLQTVPFLYESTLVGFVAKPNNFGGQIKIYGLYPDYQIISIGDVDNGLMEPSTHRFIKDMELLLSAAKTMHPTGIPPTGVKRVTRNNRLYASKRISNTTFLVPTYYQMVEDGFIDE